MNWQAKDIEKKQSEEKTYKRGGLRPLFYIHRFFMQSCPNCESFFTLFYWKSVFAKH